MINRRLLRQLEELQQYKEKVIIIEGVEEQELYSEEGGMNPNAIRGFILSILLKHKIPIIFTKDSEDTAKFISVIAKKQDREMSFKPTKRVSSKKEQMEFILEGFPGIGPTTAKKLLKEFKTIKEVMNAPEEELQRIIGKKSEAIKKIVEDSY
jgi:Fanconi anemia group M protein